VVAGANVHDTKLLEATLEATVVAAPTPRPGAPIHLCLDKGYDNPTGRETVALFGVTAHVRRIGEEAVAAADRDPRKRPRRWVVERTIGWLNRCRALLVRYAKKADNYLGLIQLACALLWFRRLQRLRSRT